MYSSTLGLYSSYTSKWLLAALLLLCSISSVAATTTPTSITVRWTAPSDEDGAERAAAYDVRYSTSSIVASGWNDLIQAIGEPAPGLSGYTDSFTIVGLNPDTWYYVVIKSADQALNWSEMSNVLYVKTQSLIEELPKWFTLSQNYPNPFNLSTKIDYYLPFATDAEIDIINVLGQHVATIVDDFIAAGNHSVVWDGVSSRGHDLPSGVYFYRIRADDFENTKKMMLIK